LKGPSSRVLRRTGLALVAATICVAAAFLLLPLAVQGLLRVLDLVLTGCIWLTTSLGSDADAWTILAAVGRAAARALMTTRVLAVVGALVLMSALALYGLQRLLGTEEESAP
jgi:Na+/phosphate symporter